MYSQDANNHKILELHIWVAFVFDLKTGSPLLIETFNSLGAAKKWYKGILFKDGWDIRYTMASIREFQ